MHNPENTSPAPNAEDQRIEFGRRLREMRSERNLTLAEMSELTGLAISTLSKVERGLMALTYDRLSSLASGLGMELAALFGREGNSFEKNSLAIARVGEFQPQETEAYSYEILFPDVWQKAMTPMTGVVKAHSKIAFDDYIRHPGQEFVFVLSGKLKIYTENHPAFTLAAGESIYLDSGMGHIYTSASDEDARILVVACPDK